MTAIAVRVRSLIVRLRGVFAPATRDARLDDEMRFHLEMAAARNEREGMAPAEARRAAHMAFGGRERFRDEARDEYRARPLADAAQDVRYAWRMLRRRPAFLAMLVITLACGIGAFTTVFSVVNGVLLEPLPYPRSGRLLSLTQHWDKTPDGPGSISPAEYFDYRDQLRDFESFGVYETSAGNLTGEAEPQRVSEAAVSAGVLPALGVRPLLGRLFTAAEDAPGANDVILLGESLWRSRYGADPAVIGRRVLLDGADVMVVGVLPDGFRLPDEMASPAPAQVFQPMALDRTAIRIRGSHYLSGVGRVRDGISVERGAAAFADVARAFVQRLPADYPAVDHFGATALPLTAAIVGPARAGLLMLLGAVFLVLVIACVNAAGLLLAQAESRRQEVAVRTAMGASRGRIVRQLLVESLVPATLAGALGVALALGAVRVLVRAHPIPLPRLAEVSVSGPVLAFALLVTIASAIAFGLAPALQLVRTSVEQALRGGGGGGSARGATAGVERKRTWRALVAGEIAMSIILLLGAGLLTKSFARLLAVDPGFTVEHILTVPVALPYAGYEKDAKVIAVFQQLTERAGALPGVRAAGAVAGIPLQSTRGDMGVTLEGHPIPMGTPHPQADWQVVTPGYMEAIGMHLARGRFVAPTDLANTPGVGLINETMATRYWPGDDPIGKRFTLGGNAGPGVVTVIGVVTDVHQAGLDRTPKPEMYLAHSQFRFWGGGAMLRSLTLAVRTTGDPTQLSSAVTRLVHEVAPDVPLGSIQTMEQVRATSVALPRFLVALLGSAAAVAFAIAVFGLYGVVAYSVAQRRHEFGVRAALGATRADIARLVLRDSVTITASGILIGTPAAVAGGRLVERWLFEVRATDPMLLVAVPLTLAIVATIAAYLPARRAASVDPMAALRGD